MRIGAFSNPKCLILLVLGSLQFASSGSSAAAVGPEESKLIVVLYPDADDGRPGNVHVDRGIRSVFKDEAHRAVEVHSEQLDLTRFPDAAQDRIAEHLRQKYLGRKVDLVIAGLASGLDFALKHRERMFPGVPIVFCAVDEKEAKARDLPSDVIGVPIKMDLAATLEIATRLLPATKRIYVVTGNSKFDRQWEAEARRQFRAYEDKLEFVYLAGLPLSDLKKRVAELPPDSIVFYVHIFEDGDGAIVVPAEGLMAIAAHTNVPIFGHVDSYVGRGIVGGRVFRFEDAGRNAARLSLRLLAGEKADTIGVQPPADNPTIFDARELDRWGIPRESLPAGSEVRHHESTFWDLYRWHVLGVASLGLVETLLIVGLLVQRASRRRAEQRLQQAVGDLRQSQDELRELTGRLLQAQEIERRRIARELHDDLNQNLALLSVELDMIGQNPSHSASVHERLQKLSAQVKQLSSSVHDLSHQLHPSKLEQLGLVAAIRSLCKEFTQAHGLPIIFEDRGLTTAFAADTALCLYRIAQEALQNVVKHSGARRVEVELIEEAAFLRLRVIDDGKGFDAGSLTGRESLGLVSMRERVRLVHGELAINSQPAAGTRIEVRVPLDR